MGFLPTFLFHMRAEEIAARVGEQVEQEIAAMGYDLVDVTFVRGLLQITIDKPQGISLEDCVEVNRRVGLLMDTMDFVTGSYRLEVTSPGLTRRLKTQKDFKHFSGRLIKVVTNKGTIKGILKGIQGDSILVERGGEVSAISFSDMVKANLDFEF